MKAIRTDYLRTAHYKSTLHECQHPGLRLCSVSPPTLMSLQDRTTELRGPGFFFLDGSLFSIQWRLVHGCWERCALLYLLFSYIIT